jgi:hypothetical protein
LNSKPRKASTTPPAHPSQFSDADGDSWPLFSFARDHRFVHAIRKAKSRLRLPAIALTLFLDAFVNSTVIRIRPGHKYESGRIFLVHQDAVHYR